MAYEQYNLPLAGDILDDLAMAFREIFSKVGWLNKNGNKNAHFPLSFIENVSFLIRSHSFILKNIEF